jgi:hypothetical protein
MLGLYLNEQLALPFSVPQFFFIVSVLLFFRRKALYFKRKLCTMLAAYSQGEVPLEKVTASVQGWVNHARYGNTVGLCKAILMGEFIPPTRE